ncbi:hypothetical protein SmJEL517_g04874 [Synchytrium microbalum]|uniref:DNA mismatch repair protein PMS1 n=1 Tax=Synchytrium microbalum TaxID=1806994 RepID=A0A507BXQ8_9FUNG|nr:uncharacterized protein SmJEL517_g04874 [Synchytrium microbalum]TPX31918.1 hypothetical protein SmJEL517_g04874 [Synchytrium microbalum]
MTAVMKIKALDKSAVHRICSGQVILDLATAIKELVENSLDAGSTTIEIRLKDSGVEGFEVIDNGHGIDPENHDSVALKHYTSKINDFDDVSQLGTYGFRGEALSSLCSIATVTITTATREMAPAAVKLELDSHGAVKKRERMPREKGTSVYVSHLFESLPVRYREFKKNIKREYSKCLDVLYGYAVISTGVRLSCWNGTGKGDKTMVFATSGNTDMKTNISSIYGSKILPSLMSFQFDIDHPDTESEIPIHVQGYMSKPSFGCGRNTSDRQFFFVNKRPFDSVKFTKALNEVYRSYNSNQLPIVFVNVTLSPDTYDVNLTPDKRTILFHHEDAILELFKTKLSSIMEPLRGSLLIQPKLSIASISPKEVSDEGGKRKRDDDEEAEEQQQEEDEEDINEEEETTSSQDTTAGLDDDEQEVDDALQQSYSNGEDMVIEIGDDDDDEGATIPSASSKTSIPIPPITPSSSMKLSQITKASSSSRSKKSSPVKRGMMPTLRKPPPSIIPSSKTINAVKKSILSTPSSLSRIESVKKTSISVVTPVTQPRTDADGTSIQQDAAILESLYEDVTISYTPTGIRDRISSNMSRFYREKILRQPPASTSSKVSESQLPLKKFETGISAEEKEQAEDEFNKFITKDDFKKMEILGQFNLGFIIARLEDDLFIIDQHATDEKFNYEDLKRNLRLEGQKLFLPQSLSFTVQQELIVMDNLDLFKRNGFDIEVDEAAPSMHRLKLVSCPFAKNVLLGASDVEELVHKLCESGAGHDAIRPSRIDSLIASKACRKSVMIGMALERSRMIKIVAHMGDMDQPWVLSSPRRRIETDVMKLLMSDYEVTLVNDNMQEFYVRFHGPKDTPFATGIWKVHVELPDQYPYKSPSIGFMNKIFHPNIDELSGSVCLDVINQTWSPMFDMINIFEVFLPQLLRYPNPTDPLNGEAAALLMREPTSYEQKVRDYVAKYATKEAADAATDDSDSEEDMSSVGSFSEDEAQGMEL